MKAPNQIKSDKIRGALIMVGEYENDEIEVIVRETNPVNPTTAAEELDIQLVDR